MDDVDTGTARRLDVERVRKDFPILERRVGPDGATPLVYLDSSATSQKPRQVIDALTDYYERHNANIHRGVYSLAEEATAMYEEARAKLARFVGAPDPSCIVFTRGTTESTNLVAHGFARKFLGEGDEILLSVIEHHSNLVPWQFVAQATGATLRYLSLADDGTLDLSDLGSLLTERTKLVAVTGMSNVLGTLPPIRELTDAAHTVGAAVLVDGAQLVPHVPVDVQALDVDFLTVSGHKMLGPTASGGLYGKREQLDRMDPFLGGGEMIMEVYPDRSTFKEPPWKFEAGTMNIAQEIGLGVAVDYLLELGMDAVREHEKEITAYAIRRLTDAGAKVFGPTDVDVRGGAVSFWFRDIHPHDLAQVLDTDGVCVRAGHHCAQPLMRVLGVPATVRASFYVYNNGDEVDALVAALERAEGFFGA
ncbi:MAG TPA: SufS family cysteine desulfurase [Actinomycetota bacterium]|nr:SufS family cysteine desulfurase [Actinomycetota bacterium]